MSVRKSLIWSYGSQFATFVVAFATSVIIARLLSPREMGVYATAMALSGLIAGVTTFGVNTYVIGEKELTRDVLRAAFTVNALLAVVLAAISLGISFIPGLLATDVRVVFALTALTPLIGLFEFTPWALTMREGRFGLFASLNTLRTICGAIASVSFAYGGFGPASLVLGGLFGSVVSVCAYAVKRPRDMLLAPTARGLRPVVTFGLQMMSIGGTAQLASRLSDLLLSRFQGLVALGLYSRASGLSYQIGTNLYGIANNIVFAKMSEELRTTDSLHRTYLRALAILTGVMWPLLIGVALLARPIIAHLYGDRWLGAAAPLTLLMIAQFIILSYGMSWELFVLRKETARQTRFELIRAAVGTVAFGCGAFIGLATAAAGRVVEALVGYALYRPHMDRLAGTAPGELERLYGRSALLTVVTVLPSALLMLWTGWSPQTDIWLILCAIAVGGGLWLAALARMRHPLFEEMVHLSSRAGERLRALRRRAA